MTSPTTRWRRTAPASYWPTSASRSARCLITSGSTPRHMPGSSGPPTFWCGRRTSYCATSPRRFPPSSWWRCSRSPRTWRRTSTGRTWRRPGCACCAPTSSRPTRATTSASSTTFPASVLGRAITARTPSPSCSVARSPGCRRSGSSLTSTSPSAGARASPALSSWTRSSTGRRGSANASCCKRYLRLMAPDLETSYRDEHTYPADWLRPDEAKRTLVHRLVTHDDTPDGGAFLVRLRDSGATVTTMFEAELKMHRRWFSLLCDPHYQHLLDADELATIEQYVPHTYDLRPGTVDAAVAEKDRLVFKRSYTYGGKGGLIGDQHSPGQLRALLTADGSAWVAQRRVYTSSLDLRAADGRTMPFYLVLGMFLYGDQASGLLVRATARSPLVNVSQDGGASWAFVE